MELILEAYNYNQSLFILILDVCILAVGYNNVFQGYKEIREAENLPNIPDYDYPKRLNVNVKNLPLMTVD